MSTVAKQMRAKRVSMILIALLVLLLCALIGGSAFAATRLLKQSSAATHAQIDADVSADDPSRLEALKSYLAKNEAGIQETATLTEGIGKYDQNSIVAAINGYAGKSGVSITSYSFATAAAGAVPAAGSASSGNTVNLTLGSPLKYQNFIVFLRLVEQGLMPAQVVSAQIDTNKSEAGTISVSSLSIKVVQ